MGVFQIESRAQMAMRPLLRPRCFYDLVVYPQVFERYELEVRHGTILLARGRVDRRGEVVHIRANRFERLDLPARSLDLRSRDFH